MIRSADRLLRELSEGVSDRASMEQLAELVSRTVNDHLKAVFRKTGAGSRAELTAALTG